MKDATKSEKKHKINLLSGVGLFSGYLILLLAMLLYTLILTFMDHKCVFGPKVCPTDLENILTQEGVYALGLTQRQTPIKAWPATLQQERMTFQYTVDDDAPRQFYVDINYNGIIPLVDRTSLPPRGACWPTAIGPSSGYATFLAVDENPGVSIYIWHYEDQVDDWTKAFEVVNYGVSVLLDTVVNVASPQAPYAAIVPQPSGMLYTTGWFGTGGGLTVSSNLADPGISTFFTQLADGTGAGLNLEKISASPHTYNPMNDWYSYKKIKDNDKCTPEKPENCSCVEPSAKNLPPCTNPKIPGKGYIAGVIGEDLQYSRNCFHGAGQIEPTPANSNQIQRVEQSVPLTSALGDQIEKLRTDPDQQELYTKLLADLKIGNTPLEDFNDRTNQQNYFPNRLFCGGGNADVDKGSDLIYPATDTDPNSDDVAFGMFRTSWPLYKKIPGTDFLTFSPD
jgi:hypothetical protein